jgi:cadmium resistance protein CadD (predicted permease)
MFSIIITATTSFISTNIDDIFVLMILFSQTDKDNRKINVVIGQYCGIGILFFISILGTFGVNFLAEKYIGFLGFLPIILGIKSWIAYKTQKKSKDKIEDIKSCSKNDRNTLKTNNIFERLIDLFDNFSYRTGQIHSGILSVIAITIANGADNIGIYIPIFSGYSLFEYIVTIIVFILLIALWCYLGNKIADYPFIKIKLQKYKNILVPIIFIGLGIYIIIKSGMIDFNIT